MTGKQSKFLRFFFIPLLIVLVSGAGFYILTRVNRTGPRTRRVISFIRNPQKKTGWITPALSRCHDSTPFTFPSEGYIGYLWDDSFRPGHRHQGIDIFSGTPPGATPVYAAYDGYLTRQSDWKSSLIIRIPEDPLNPTRQIWIYYTHLADDFGQSLILDQIPPGTYDLPVQAGDLLGYQGNYSGNPGNPVGVHLHFSIVKDDGSGSYLNELKITNTIDPSPYFDLPLNAKENPDQIPTCLQDF